MRGLETRNYAAEPGERESSTLDEQSTSEDVIPGLALLGSAFGCRRSGWNPNRIIPRHSLSAEAVRLARGAVRPLSGSEATKPFDRSSALFAAPG
jgi:hypothetical protein